MVSFLTFVGFISLRLGYKDSYVKGLGFLCLGASNSYAWRLVFLRLEVSFVTFGG